MTGLGSKDGRCGGGMDLTGTVGGAVFCVTGSAGSSASPADVLGAGVLAAAVAVAPSAESKSGGQLGMASSGMSVGSGVASLMDEDGGQAGIAGSVGGSSGQMSSAPRSFGAVATGGSLAVTAMDGLVT